MNKKVFRLIFMLVLASVALPIQAQEEVLEKINCRLKEGNCESAQKLYNAYKDAYNQTDKDIERRIAACKDPKDFTAQGFVDLGLPSGTLWMEESEHDNYFYSEAMTQFGSNIPSNKQWAELMEECTWEWNESVPGECFYKVIGKNGKYIRIKANGYVDVVENLCVGCGGDGGVHGYYFSSKPINNENLEVFSFVKVGKGLLLWKLENLSNCKLGVIQAVMPPQERKLVNGFFRCTSKPVSR